jgi:predicted dehydrogenase
VHAAAAVMAMQMGKHVYVQKPLTYSVHEARVLRDLARETGVVTQMGNQGHSGDDGRRLLEWVWAGAIGPVHEAHIWTNRPIWPQGIPRPDQSEPVPKEVDWDLWLGPAPSVPYHSAYMPFSWRGWTDWGTGALGDMGAHLVDHTYWALDLKYPTTIEASGSPYGGEDKASYPMATIVHYLFARGGRDPVTMTWYDGGLLPARPPVMPADAEVNRGGGAMLIGERGVLVYDTYGNNPRLFPESLQEEYTDVPQTLPRIEVSHEMNWVNACKGLNEPSCPFEYAAPLTETMLLGVVALQAGYGRKLTWDGENGHFIGAPDADAFLHREYRSGWSL